MCQQIGGIDEGLYVCRVKGWKQLVRQRVLQNSKNVLQSGKDEIGVAYSWKRSFGREPLESITNTFHACFPNPYVVVTIRFKGRSNVPTVNGMCAPRKSIARLLMYHNTNSGWGQGHPIVIKSAMYLGICRKFQINVQATEQAECE